MNVLNCAATFPNEVDAYDQLQPGRGGDLVLKTVDDLPKALIQAQRYEATEYDSASFSRIRKVAHALRLRLPQPARLVRER